MGILFFFYIVEEMNNLIIGFIICLIINKKNGNVKIHQDLKLVIVQTMQESKILNNENVPKTDVLDPGNAFNFVYSLSFPVFLPSVK